jgi:superoxide dismutase, Cu-Zn family
MRPIPALAARRAYRGWAVVIAGSLTLLACGGPAEADRMDVALVDAGQVTADGTLAPPEGGGPALTYNPAVAPAGARLAVTADATPNATTVALQVTGLLPNRGYAAHVHQLPCGPTGAAAGPHHQHEVDPAAGPEKPSSDPACANARNEIWLDLRTDGSGNGAVQAVVPFALGDRRPASVIVHEAERTATEPGKAGTAGARVACLSVPFAQVTAG